MKKHYFFVLLFTVALFSFTTRHTVSTRVHALVSGRDFVADQLLIKPAVFHSVTSSLKSSFLQRYVREIRSISLIEKLGWELVQTQPGIDLADLRLRLQKESWIKEVSYNYIFRISEKTPNDHYFQFQYALKNTGQEILEPGSANNKSGTKGADIKATEAWDYATGEASEVVVAVIDTGVASFHEDLKNKIVPGYNILADDNLTEDDNGHGTFVASIIGAETDNGVGISGVSWKAKIMPIKALDETGAGTSIVIASAIRYAAEHGAKVINMSFGITEDSPIVKEACAYAFDSKKCVLVGAAGNSGQELVEYPAAYDQYCLAVGASDYNDQLADFSNYGSQIDVVAPGVYIWGAYFDPAAPTSLRDYKVSSLPPLSNAMLGTSCSAAFVSGAAALYLSQKPNLGDAGSQTPPDLVMKMIRYTADDVNKDSYKGKDNKIGYGRINLLKLLGPYTLTTSGNGQLP